METRTSTLCRCCASEGPSKDLINKYIWMGEEEVYSDMLKECFDISLTMESQNEQGICELCITQLRNAFNFKKQVLFTDKEFRKNLSEEKPFQVEIKQEAPHSESGSEAGAGDVPFNDDDDDDGSGSDYEPLIKKEVEEKPKKRQAKVAAVGRPKRAKTEPATSKSKREPVTEVINTDENEEKSNTKTVRGRKKTIVIKTKKPEVTFIDDKYKQLWNVRAVLRSSNATPIKRKGSIGFACAFCNIEFTEAIALKTHTLDNHTSGIENFMEKARPKNLVFKLDITNLQCSICNTKIDILENLIEHLRRVHDTKIYDDIKNNMVPFKFDRDTNYCVVCDEKFNNFKVLLVHMNKHYGNYICEVCGTSFVNMRMLQVHGYGHMKGEYPCSKCNKIFDTKIRKWQHERGVHVLNNKRSKCGYCKETFGDYSQKNEHIASVHGGKRVLIKCKDCDKVFKKTSALKRHIRKDHLLERNHVCKECNMAFFEAHNLKEHMRTHSGERLSQCDICFKSYGRKKALKDHMKVHEDKFA